MANVLTPVVAGIHFDDLEQLFHLKITFQVKTPLGTFEREIFLTASDLAGIIAQLVQIWSAASPTSEADHINFVLGDLSVLAARIAAFTPGTYDALAVPTPPSSDLTTDAHWGTYVGTTDTGGGEAWGGTSPG
jgi:hypothetical protein